MIPPSLTQQFQQIYFQRKCENLVLKPRQRTLLCKKEDILTNPPLNFKKTISKMWLARVNPKRNYIPHHRCKPSLKQKRDLNYVHYSLGPAFALISKQFPTVWDLLIFNTKCKLYIKKLRCFVTVLSPVYTGLQSTATVPNHSVPLRIHVARFISSHFSHEFAHLVLVMGSNKDQTK